MAEYVSPGVAGFPTQSIQARGASGLTAAKLARRKLDFKRAALEAGHAQVFRPAGISTSVQLQGFNVLITDMFTVSEFLSQVMWPLLDISGQLVVHNARQFVPIDTGDTYKSIHYNLFTEDNMVAMEAGPTTFYAPWLEYGTSKMAPRPFMIPALDMMETALRGAVTQISEVAASRRKIDQQHYGKLDQILSKYRSELYSDARFLGDLTGVFGIGILPGLRSNMIQRAQEIGNIQAVMRGHIGQRVTNIFTGRLIGRAQSSVVGGGKSGGMSINTQLGPQFARIYNTKVSRIGGSLLR